MIRDVTAAAQSSIEASVVNWFLLFEAQFDSATLRFWTGIGELSYGGNTYTGAGTLIGFGSIKESVDLRNDATAIELQGLDSTLISLALQEDYQGRPIIVSLGTFDSDRNIVADPVPILNGLADQMVISEDGKTATIRMTVESEVARFDRRSLRRYTAAGLQAIHPDDKGLNLVDALIEKDIRWGGQKGGGGSSKSVTAPVEFDNNPR